MSHYQHDTYLKSKVLTASSPRLHLMLIEGAIRFGRRASEALACGDAVAADEPLLRCLDIVGELLTAVREGESEINHRLADLYLYLFRTVSEAKINADAAKVDEVLRLLEYERETWQLVCEKSTPPPPPVTADAPLPIAGLSLEA